MMPEKNRYYKHKSAKRRNIPTDRDQVFMAEEDHKAIPFAPEPSGTAGPVLSWRRGNSIENIRTDALPLYIHEKVNPSAFVEQLSKRNASGEQMNWIHEFNGLPTEAKYNWYKYKGDWSNRIIRGNSVDVMASLAAKEDLDGEVQMVFFDPPYGISFASNYQSTTKRRQSGQPIDGASRKAFRDTYTDGLHSYMDTVFKVAAHARALLTDSGSFFLQIGAENVHRLSIVLDEVFGLENRIATITFAKSGSTSGKHLSQVADYLLWYAKDREQIKSHQIYDPLKRKQKVVHMSSYVMVELPDGTCRNLTPEEHADPDKHLPDKARLFRRMPLHSQGTSTAGRSEDYSWNGTVYPCPPGRQWSVDPMGLDRLAATDRLIATSTGELAWKKYEDEIGGQKINNIWHKQQAPDDIHYVVETAEITIERCILMTTDPGDLVLDPTCGSGTTAVCAERWGRRWITIDASAIPVALCRQRVLTQVHKWHLTLDDLEGQRKEAELASQLAEHAKSSPFPSPPGSHAVRSGADPAAGFVYKRVPYVSAAHLAYDRPPTATLLVNQTVQKRGVRRISAPFTVESHSPWVYVSPADTEADEHIVERDTGVRENVIAALEIAGIPDPETNGDRWRLENFELAENSDPPNHITHEAVLRASGERVAIAVLPDDRTANTALIDTAARAAAARNFRKLLVVAFQFEADVQNEQRAKLRIVLAQANRDLTIDELKSGREDDAFVLIGEPDVDLNTERLDGTWQVTVKGYNVYDPGSGNVRRGGEPDNIDCWMIDANYDGKSFFAHQIHFPGKSGDKQIATLKRILASRIDPTQWKYMESLTSAPFRPPKSGRIAIRIVTEFGDEMLTVLPNDHRRSDIGPK